MTFCGDASAWSKVALIVILVALGLHSGGYGTNYWMARYTVRDTLNFGVGLWRVTNCSGSYKAPCYEYDVPAVYITKYMQATRALEGVALGLLFVTSVCLTFYVGTTRSRTRGMAISIMVLAFLAAVGSITGMAVWIMNLPEYHYANWSLGLTVFACTLSITSGILLIPDVRQYDYKDSPQVGGQFRNLSVTEAAKINKKQPEPEPIVEGEVDLKPKIIPQHPLAAPSYQYMPYNKKKLQDGF